MDGGRGVDKPLSGVQVSLLSDRNRRNHGSRGRRGNSDKAATQCDYERTTLDAGPWHHKRSFQFQRSLFDRSRAAEAS